MKKFILCAALLLAALPCLAQSGILATDSVTTWTWVYGQPVATLLPGASMTVCSYPATGVPCTNTVTVYSNADLASNHVITNVVLDKNSNYSFYVPAGVYQFTVTKKDGTSYGPYFVRTPVYSVGGGASATINGSTAPFTFTGSGVSQSGSTFTFSGGSGTAGSWGSISGLITSQTDLQTALSSKVDLSGSYVNPNWITSLSWSKITSVPTASGTTSGVLSSTDWSTFNNKLNASSFTRANVIGLWTACSGYLKSDGSCDNGQGVVPATTGQIAVYTSPGSSVGGSSSIPNGITATTQIAGDNSTKVATTAYVDGAIVAAGGGNVTGASSSTNGNVVVFNGTTGKAIGDSGKALPTGAIVGTSDTQTLTGKTVNGVTPTTFGYLDPTSSVQTQLNAKVPATRTVNGKPLSTDISVTASDVGNTTAQWNANQVNGAAVPQSVTFLGTNAAGQLVANGTGVLPLASGGTNATTAAQARTNLGITYANLSDAPVLPANTTATAHNFFTAYNSTTGAFTAAQPSCSDLSNAGSLCSSSSTLPVTKTAASGQALLSYDSSTGAFTQGALTASQVGALPSTTVLPVTKTAASGQPLLSYDSTTGAFTQGALTAAQVGALASTTVLPANTTSTAHQFFTAYNSTAGAYTKAQPACGDISDAGNICTHSTSEFQAAGNYVTQSTTTAGHFLRNNGTSGYVDATIQASDVPILNQSTTGTASNITASSNSTLTSLPNLAVTETQVANLGTDLAAKAPLASPTFTGTPAAPTATTGTSTTQIATTAFVAAAISASGGGNVTGPGSATSGNFAALDSTGKVLSDSGKNSSSFLPSSTTIPTASSTNPAMDGTAAPGVGATYARADHVHPTDTSRAPVASPTFTGTPAGPTAVADTSTTQLATTAFVTGQASATNPAMDGTVAVGTSVKYARADHVHPSDTSRAPLASPTFTGTPAAPTAAADTNTTQVSTTAFVLGQAAATNPVMDGAAAIGTSTRFAKADHVHPSDTSRQAAMSGVSSDGASGLSVTGKVSATGGIVAGSGSVTVSGLASLTSMTVGDIVEVSDGQSVADCSTGGGTTYSQCVCKAVTSGSCTSWQALATNGSGTIASTTSMLRGNGSGSAVAATAGTDYLAPGALPTGTTATTASANDNSTKIATTSYVDTAVAAISASGGIPGFTTAPTPTATVAAGSYSGTQTVSFSCGGRSIIYCGITGQDPLASCSNISVSATSTYNVGCYGAGYIAKPLTTFAYTIGGTSQLATPTYSPLAGTYTGTQTVTVSSTAGSTICYTTDGSTPAASTAGTCSAGSSMSTGGTVSIVSTSTLNALATKSGSLNSTVASGLYTINAGGSNPAYANNFCNGYNFGGTSQTCAFGSNLGATGGHVVLVSALVTAGNATLSASGCGITWSSDTAYTDGTSHTARLFWGIVPSAGACTVTVTSSASGSMQVQGSEYMNTSGVDVHASGYALSGYIASGTPFSCPAVTTTISNDLVVCSATDTGNQGVAFTAGTGYSMNNQSANFGVMFESATKAPYGSVTPTASYAATANILANTIALKP